MPLTAHLDIRIFKNPTRISSFSIWATNFALLRFTVSNCTICTFSERLRSYFIYSGDIFKVLGAGCAERTFHPRFDKRHRAWVWGHVSFSCSVGTVLYMCGNTTHCLWYVYIGVKNFITECVLLQCACVVWYGRLPAENPAQRV